MAVPLKDSFLQSNLDAKGFTILNLDVTGLGLTRASVGLPNVDNTSDLAKPISTLTAAALALKEPLITAGTTGQFWRGDKTFVNYGALALQDGATTLPLLSSIGVDASSGSSLQARRSDFGSSGVKTEISHGGASQLGSILAGGIPSANAGALVFTGAARGVIKTTNSASLDFGTNSILRMRLLLGLNVGGTSDPGQGSIACSFDLTVGQDATITRDLTVGNDILATGDISGNTVFAPVVTGNQIYAPLTTPASAVATGIEGRIAWDANYIYVWTGTNAVKRVAISTW